MKIHSITSLFSIPFVVAVFYYGYLTFVLDNPNSYIYFFIAILITVIFHVFQPQIDYYWYSRHPQRLDEKEQEILNLTNSFYNSLDEDEKVIFEQRVYVFMRSKEFKWVREEQKELPLDMKLIIAANAIQLTLYRDNYQYGKYDYYFAYNHPFPTPKKQFLHSVEVDHEDKMAIFNIEYLVQSQNVNNKIFNIGLFAFAEIFLKINSTITFSTIDKNSFWADMEKISGIKEEAIINHIGYRPESLYPVIITIFFMYPENFKLHLPERYKELSNVFLKK